MKNPPTVPFEVVIVDDASTPPLEQLLAGFRTQLPIHFVRNPSNLGFAGSCNRGAVAACGHYLLFINNDTEVLNNWWSPMQQALESRPDAGIVVPKLVFPDTTIQHCGKVWKDISVGNCSAHHIYYRMPADADCVNKSRSYTVVTGACMLVRRGEFFEVGCFDEQYENGWEDDDLCYAYQARGQHAWYCAESTIIHHQSQTLNRELRNLQQAIPAAETLRDLNARLASNTADQAVIGAAEQAQEAMVALESRMQYHKQVFELNRQHFMDKWAERIARDDYRYYQEDGFDADPDIPRYAPELQQLLGRPFEHDAECDATMTARIANELPGVVSIVILTWNQLEYTKQCLESIQKYTPERHEIIFVDNGSTDGTVDWLQAQAAEHQHYKLVENGINLGFAKGCNQGIEAASGDFILLLNNDVIVTADWLAGLLECLDTSDKTGIVGPMTNNISGVQRLVTVGYERLEDLPAFAASYRERFRHRRIAQRRIVGFCMLFRRRLVEEIGLLDEQFGSGNFEDDDYCVRAALAGYTNMIAGDVFIHHYGSVSFQANQLDYSAAIQGNGALFRKKWSRPLAGAEALAAQVLKVLEKAELLHQRQEFSALIETVVQEGIRYAHDELRLYYALARYLLDGGRCAEAEELLLSYSPGISDAEGLTLLGLSKLGNGQLDAAATLADRALRLAPEYAPALCLQGMLARERKERQYSMHCFQAALAADPGFGEAATRLGQELCGRGEHQKGLAKLAQGFMLTPLSSLTREAYHAAVCASGRYDQALALFRDALQFAPEAKGIMYLLIDLLLKAQQGREAMALIESAMVRFGVEQGMLTAALGIRQQLGSEPGVADGPTVSLCMIVKDEQANLARCLYSLKPIVHEMIIVDTGSTDLTGDIARAFGAKLFEQPWNGDFSAARNTALEKATGEWILVMDADEVIAAQDHSRFRQLLQDDPALCGYTMMTRNYRDSVSVEGWVGNDGCYPLQEQGGGWVPSSKIRLFPNRPDIRFEKPVHELVDYSIERLKLPVRALPIPVHHYGYLDKDRQRRKQEQYYTLGCEKLRQDGNNDLKALAELAVQAAELERYHEAIELWEKVLVAHPDFILAWFNMGYCYVRTGQLQKALEASRTVLRLNPKHREAAINAAIAAFCLGDDEVSRGFLSPFEGDANPTIALVLACLDLCSASEEKGADALRELQNKGICLDQFMSELQVALHHAGATQRSEKISKFMQVLMDGSTEQP